MKYFIEIFLYIILLFNKSQQNDENILLTNDLTNIDNAPHTILTSNNRLKREKSRLLSSITYPTSISEECDQDVHDKLSHCATLNNCKELASCVAPIHCPVANKSYGSLIINLLHLLGVNNCNDAVDSKSSCSSGGRSIIFQDLFTHWGYSQFNDFDDYEESSEKIDSYCHTIPKFIDEVKEKIKHQCPIYSRQVEAFLEHYLCSNTHHQVSLTSTSATNNVFNEPFDRTKLRNFSSISSRILYSDEEEKDDFSFITSIASLSNTTEQTIYINDHPYYNVSYIVPKSESIPSFYVQEDRQFIRMKALHHPVGTSSDINLGFNFSFYGRSINRILVKTDGFIFMGDLSHATIVRSSQYIAPLMAKFDLSIGDNRSEVMYFGNSTHFICTWKNLYLKNQKHIGAFTFQAILQNTGNIYINYINIPSMTLWNLNSSTNIGLSDAYVSEDSIRQHKNGPPVVVLYDKLNLDKEKIKSGVTVILTMYSMCNTFTDCRSCLVNRGKRYNCSWCDNPQQCSDGNDRSHYTWIQARCYNFASEDTCFNSFNRRFNPNGFQLSSSNVNPNKIPPNVSVRQQSALYTLRTVVITLLITVLVLSLTVIVSTYTYAYRHPTSPPGMWLLEHRPSNYIARFKNFSGATNSSC
ncbi:unnamed protein product [Rotaria socialis]|uniref:PSI domain-containing protein n=1 Tax=Rotaria socialis TaxID=392032 RepID=A0A820NAW2_9BILA|nr:unnamed protein product [Rotaria socialis]CAF3380992.1 unnamed protein product [Rotaria socialis]CAF4388620.1 unnamed protein product [Rotaria socialis]CAF4741787.1 unnamed protein product [Rotaria socialis]